MSASPTVGRGIFPPRRALNFAQINMAAMAVLPALLARWLPEGKRVGREFIARNPTRADRSPGSFKVVLTGGRAGSWADFATGDRGGDPVSLCAYIHNMSQGDAARALADMLGVPHDC